MSSSSNKGSKGAEKQTADTIRLEELAVENGRMRDDLKKLRDALSDEAGEDNAQFKEMIGERVSQNCVAEVKLSTFHHNTNRPRIIPHC